MNSILKNALMVTLLVSAGSAVCNQAEDQLFDAFAAGKRLSNNQSYWSQMAAVASSACAYLAEMPKSVDGTYLTADNAKNVLAKAGVAAVVAAAAYGIYKVAFKKAKKEVDCAPVRFV